MAFTTLLIMALAGMISGILAGFLGIGGGIILVPLLVRLGFEPIQAAATSSLAIVVTATVGSWQNWRMGHLDPKRVVLLGLPAVLTAFAGAWVGDRLAPHWLLVGFGGLLLINLYLVGLRKRLIARQVSAPDITAADAPAPTPWSPTASRLVTGGLAGFMAGLFGVGGGVIMVPLQLLLLAEPIKTAVRTSLGVVVITAISACWGHFINGNILFPAGLTLGCGGLVGVQLSTRFLPRLPERTISLLFRTLLWLLALYIFWQAWQQFQGR